jgi:8-oxo-dGTP diphosphatase
MVLIAASVALVRRDDVLLIQRNRRPSEGLWTLPGGRLEPGETIEECAVREVKEELGVSVFGLKPIRKLRHGDYGLQVFGTQIFEGDMMPDPVEVRAWRWVRPNDLSGLRTTPGLDEVIAAAFRMFDRT